MRKFANSTLNILLALGVVLILSGLFCAFQLFTRPDEQLPLISVLISVAGAILLYISLVIRANAFTFFAGLYVFLMGAVSFFITLEAFQNVSFRHLWPFLMLICAACLFLTCLYKYRAVRSVYCLPALVIGALGGVFLLFSFGILRFSFVEFFSKWWPLISILAGGSLVFLFFYQQTPNNIFPFESEDSADFTDEVQRTSKSKRG